MQVATPAASITTGPSGQTPLTSASYNCRCKPNTHTHNPDAEEEKLQQQKACWHVDSPKTSLAADRSTQHGSNEFEGLLGQMQSEGET
jgi:hypothetical protein